MNQAVIFLSLIEYHIQRFICKKYLRECSCFLYCTFLGALSRQPTQKPKESAKDWTHQIPYTVWIDCLATRWRLELSEKLSLSCVSSGIHARRRSTCDRRSYALLVRLWVQTFKPQLAPTMSGATTTTTTDALEPQSPVANASANIHSVESSLSHCCCPQITRERFWRANWRVGVSIFIILSCLLICCRHRRILNPPWKR